MHTQLNVFLELGYVFNSFSYILVKVLLGINRKIIKIYALLDLELPIQSVHFIFICTVLPGTACSTFSLWFRDGVLLAQKLSQGT